MHYLIPKKIMIVYNLNAQLGDIPRKSQCPILCARNRPTGTRLVTPCCSLPLRTKPPSTLLTHSFSHIMLASIIQIPVWYLRGFNKTRNILFVTRCLAIYKLHPYNVIQLVFPASYIKNLN